MDERQVFIPLEGDIFAPIKNIDSYGYPPTWEVREGDATNVSKLLNRNNIKEVFQRKFRAPPLKTRSCYDEYILSEESMEMQLQMKRDMLRRCKSLEARTKPLWP